MKTRIIELRQKRAKLIHDARALNDQVDAESRDFSAEEQEQWDRLMDEAETLRARVDREERLLMSESDLGSPAGEQEANRPEPEDEQDQDETRTGRESKAYRAAFQSYLRNGLRHMPNREYRALQSDVDTQGGYLVTPMEFVNELIKAVDNLVYVRQWATTYQVPTADSMGAPSLENDPADPDWTSELATGSEDSTMSFGRRELHPHPLAKRIKLSRKLLRQVPDAEGLVRDRLAYKFGVTFENAYLNGSGANQPLGIFVASADGVSTSRDESTDNTTTAVTFDGLINAKYKLKQQYWPMARWLAHRDFYKIVAKLKDSDGQYLWRESVRVGEPDRMLGIPAFMSEYAPNTFTASQYVAILGDFNYYWIADALDMDMQRLEELYAETNQIGLIGRAESDGMPVLEEAFVRVQLAAS